MLKSSPIARLPEDYSGKSVSTVSLWDDDVWIMDIPSVVVHQRKIRWGIRLADGLLTDSRHRQLLLTSKALIYEMLFGDYGHYRRAKPSSAVQYVHYLARMLRWMSAKTICRFADLTPEHLISFRNLIRNSKQSPSADSSPNISRKPLSLVTQSNLLAPLRALIMLADRIPDHPRGDRRLLLDLLKVQRPRQTHGKTKRIPDEIAGPLFETARRWVTEYRSTLIAQYHAADEGYRNSPAEDPDHRSTHAHKARRRFAAQGADFEIPVRGGTIRVGSVDGLTFRSLIRHLETACFIVIAGLVGMRISEIGSLRRDTLVSKSLDDGRTMLLLKATLYKTVRDREGRVLEWVAGWHDESNPIRHAVETLIELREIDTPHSDFLFVGLKHRNTRTHVPLIAVDYRRRINDFAKFIGLDGWRFAPHQFRKTFARFVTKRDFTGLLALQRHFAHVSLQMTELYGSWDDELVADILDEDLEQDFEALDGILAADCLAGQKGEEILRRNHRFRGIAGKEAREEYLTQLRSDSSEDRLVLMRHEYGFCVLEIDTAACGMDSWKVGPPTCSDCRNLVLTEEHAPYWRGLQQSLREELDDPRTEGLAPANKQRLERAYDTVSSLLRKLEQRSA